MSLTDKVTGRVKKAAGDLTDDASLKREGAGKSARARPRTSWRASRIAPTARPRKWRTWSAKPPDAAAPGAEPGRRARRARMTTWMIECR